MARIYCSYALKNKIYRADANDLGLTNTQKPHDVIVISVNKRSKKCKVKTITSLERPINGRMQFINRKLDDFNEFLYGRKVAIIGLDKESLSIIDYLHRHSAKISIFDTRTLDTLNLNIIDRIIHYNIQYSFGEASLIKLKNVDMIIKSPEYRYDIKEIYEEESRGAIVTSVQELLIDLFPGKIIGITGNSDNEVFNFIYAESNFFI